MYIYELGTKTDKELKHFLDNKNVYNAKYLVRDDSNVIFESGGYAHQCLFIRTYGDEDTFTSSYVKYYKPLTYSRYKEILLNTKYNTVNSWSYTKFFNFILNKIEEYYGKDRVDSSDNEYITIYFPEITITNSVEQSHVIQDLYLELMVCSSGMHLYTLYRATKTIGELENSYLFSHVRSGSVANSSFCYGVDNAVRNIMDKIASSRVEAVKLISQLCPLIESYLSWESLEGVPYCKIDKIVSNEWKYTPVYVNSLKYNINELLACVKNNITSFKYSYDFEGDSYVIKINPDSINEINQLISTNFPQLCVESLNGYPSKRKEYLETEYDHLIGTKVLTFKGEEIKFNIDKSDIHSESLDLKKELHPSILVEVINNLEFKFAEFLINKKWKK